MRSVVRGQEEEVPGATSGDAAEAVSSEQRAGRPTPPNIGGAVGWPAPCSPLLAHWTVNRIVAITFPAESRASTRQAPVHSGTMALLLQVRHGDPPMRSSISAIS